MSEMTIRQPNDDPMIGIEGWLDRSVNPVEWRPLDSYNLSDPMDVALVSQKRAMSRYSSVHNPLKGIVGELYEIENPTQKDNIQAKAEFVGRYLANPNNGVRWFDFSDYDGSLRAYLKQEDHERVIHNRDLGLSTAEEQAVLRRFRVYQAGLSVGENVVTALQQSGGYGAIAIADFDTVSATGQNRTSYPYEHIGWSKVDSLAWRMAARNPYLEQVVFREGFRPEDANAIGAFKPNVMVDSIDNMLAKLQVRDVAQQIGVPVIMATDLGRKVVVRLERKDIGDKGSDHFNGCVNGDKLDKLRSGQMSQAEQKSLVPPIAGVRHASPRLLDAFMRVGEDLVSYPQKGTTSRVAGVVTALMCEQIALGKDLDSGLYVVDVDHALKIRRTDSLGHDAKTYTRFIRFAVQSAIEQRRGD